MENVLDKLLPLCAASCIALAANADKVTLPGTSWDGNLANQDNWPGSTIPSEGSGDIVLSGLVGNLTLSRDLTIGGTYTFQINGGSTVSAYVQNAQILNGTHGTDSSNLLQISFQEDADYCQFAGLNSSGILKIWVPADAV